MPIDSKFPSHTWRENGPPKLLELKTEHPNLVMVIYIAFGLLRHPPPYL